MTAALEEGEWSAARPSRTLPPGKTRYPFYRRLGGPQGRSGRAENLVPTGIRSRTVQPVVSRYTDWATGPTLNVLIRNVLLNYQQTWGTPEWFTLPGHSDTELTLFSPQHYIRNDQMCQYPRFKVDICVHKPLNIYLIDIQTCHLFWWEFWKPVGFCWNM